MMYFEIYGYDDNWDFERIQLYWDMMDEVDELFIYFSFYLVDLFYNVLYNMYVNKEVIIWNYLKNN